MIQVTLQFDSIPEAHATLGLLMAQQEVFVPPQKAAAESGIALHQRTPAPPESVTNLASDAMNAGAEAQAAAEKPKRKKRMGRPKGSKDTVVRKGTKAAEASITLDSLRDDLQSYANEHGFKAARDILQQFIGGNGQPIKRIPDLQTDDYAKFQRALAKTPAEAEAS